MKSNRNFGSAGAVLLALAVMLASVMPLAAQTRQYRDATSGFLNETTFVPLAAYTTSDSTGTVYDLGPYAAGVIHVDVTTITGSGSPSLTVNFQSCADATTTYCSNHTSSSAITATGNAILKVNNFGRYVRVTYAITGTTPSFTFLVKGAFKPQT